MKKPKVYIETTVISYYTSNTSRDLIIAGHQQTTKEWWQNHLSAFEPYISDIVFEEISCGDKDAAEKRVAAVRNFSYLPVNKDVLDLARIYYDKLNLPDKARLDAVHLALGVSHGMDFIISWNFTHISGARPRQIVEQVNYQRDIKTPIICTPEELIEE